MNQRWIRNGGGGLALGAFSLRCTTPALIVGLGMTIAFIGGFSVAFGFALWNQEQLSRSGPNGQQP